MLRVRPVRLGLAAFGLLRRNLTMFFKEELSQNPEGILGAI